MLAFVVMICIHSFLFDFRNSPAFIENKYKTTPIAILLKFVTEIENMRNNDVLLSNFLLIYKKKSLNLISTNTHKWYIQKENLLL